VQREDSSAVLRPRDAVDSVSHQISLGAALGEQVISIRV
jgi:hypothetical protein